MSPDRRLHPIGWFVLENQLHPFDAALSVSEEDIEFELRGYEVVAWADFMVTRFVMNFYKLGVAGLTRSIRHGIKLDTLFALPAICHHALLHGRAHCPIEFCSRPGVISKNAQILGVCVPM